MVHVVTRLTRILLVCGLIGLALVCVLHFLPYPPAIEQAHEAGFSDAAIATGLKLSFERRVLFWIGTTLEVALLCVLGLSGLARRAADRLLTWFGGYRIPAALAMGLCYVALHQLLQLPVGIARFYQTRAWGLGNPHYDLTNWLADRYLAVGVDLATQAIVLAAFYSLLIWLPRLWWLAAPLGAGLLGVAYAWIAPVWINPLFNTFTPLEDTAWSALHPRVRALLRKADVPVDDILVMNASRQSGHTNAYFTGFGPTRRIVLYDTLLKNHTAAEVESVLAHEIGHWKHDHIVKGILLGMLGSVFGFWLLDRFLRGAMGTAPWNLHSRADPAGLWLILLLLYAGSWLAMPAENLVSRYFERQADEMSLELARNPDAFIATERKMAIDNKSNVAPAPWNIWLFASHPPTVERIRMAEEWK